MKPVILLLFSFLASVVVSGQEQHTAVISGRFDYLTEQDVIVCYVFKYGQPAAPALFGDTALATVYRASVKDNLFKVTINHLEKGCPYEFYIRIPKYRQYIPISLIEAGDQLHFSSTDPESLAIEGKGAEKVRLGCLQFEAAIKHRFNGDSTQFINYIKGSDIDAQAQLALLNAHKDELSRKAYDVLKLRCYNTFLWNIVVYMRVFGRRGNDAQIASDLNNYVKPLLKKYRLPLQSQESLYSSEADNFLQYQYTIARCMNGDFTSTRPIGDLQGNYWFLKANFAGDAREKLVTFLMLSGSHSQNMGECYDDAVNWIKNPRWIALLNKYCAQNPGMPAYNFSLLDSNNVVHRLSDYKGKVVVMDFWFNGCENCAALTPKLKIVEDHFKDNPSVIFMSICSDRLKAFKEGIKRGIYTMPGEINLYSGMGYKDSLYQKINFQSAPALRLIDKDGNWCESPVDCRMDDGKDLIEKISIALKE